MHDLVTHVAQVYEHKIACTELGTQPDPWPPAWPADRDDVVWLTDAHARLLAMFARTNRRSVGDVVAAGPDRRVLGKADGAGDRGASRRRGARGRSGDAG